MPDPKQLVFKEFEELVPDGIPEEIPKSQEPPRLTLHEEIVKILNEYGGLESNIPTFHRYWVLLNQFRSEKSQ